MTENQSNKTIRVGVGAVVFRGDNVLLIKRGKPPMKGHWSIPGGGLDFGERITAGVEREVFEETRCRINLLGLIDVFEAIPTKAEHSAFQHTVMIDYAAEWVSGEPQAGDDAWEAEFVPIKEAIERVSWDETRRALTMAVEKRAEWAEKP